MAQELSLLRRGRVKRRFIAFQLYVLDPGKGQNLNADTVLPVKRVTTIGRDSSNDIVINEPHVSSKHARLEIVGENLYLIDLNSTNGTYVNGKRIKGKQKVFLGDEIIIGDVSFEVAGWEYESTSAN